MHPTKILHSLDLLYENRLCSDRCKTMAGRRKTRRPRRSRQSERGGPRPTRRRPGWRVLLPILIIVTAVAAYATSFSGTFVFDDTVHIVDSARIRRLWPPSVVLGGRRPLVDLSLAVNYAISGLEVWSYHAFNLAVHILAALTLFGLLRRTLGSAEPPGQDGSASAWLAGTVALIWVAHPLQTQSVTYVIQRGESMMGLFYLLTFYCVCRGAESARRRWWWYVLAVGSCAGGMASKAVMVTAPLAVLLYDRIFLAKTAGDILRRRWGLYVGLAATLSILAVCGVVRGVLDPSVSPTARVGFGFREISPLDYALTQPGVILHYLRLALWPHPLCFDYGWPVARKLAAIVVPAAVVLALLASVVLLLRRRPRLGFVGVWFFLILAPTSSIIPIRDLIYEHRMYLSLAAVVVLVVSGAHLILRAIFRRLSLSQSWCRSVNTGFVVVIVALLGYATAQRNRDYRSPLSIWKDAATKRPDCFRANYNAGVLYGEGPEHDMAARYFSDAVRIRPDHANAHASLGTELDALGKVDQAIRAYRTAIELDPTFSAAHYNLGLALQNRGQLDEAAVSYRKALSLDPSYASARFNLANTLADQGKVDAAIAEYQELLAMHPRNTKARVRLGNELVRKERLDEAIDLFRETIGLEQDNAGAHYGLGYVLYLQGQTEQAVDELRSALALDPEHSGARDALSAAQEVLSDREPD